MNEVGESLSEDVGLSYTTNLILNRTPQCSALTMPEKFFKKWVKKEPLPTTFPDWHHIFEEEFTKC